MNNVLQRFGNAGHGEDRVDQTRSRSLWAWSGAVVVVLAGLMFAPPPLQAGNTLLADAAGDWVASDGSTAGSVQGGTAAGWSYLHSDAASGGTESALVQSQNTGDEGGPGFGEIAGGGRVLSAVLGDNANGGQYRLFSNGDANNAEVGTDILLHPDDDSDDYYVIVRYTFTADIMAAGAINGVNIDGSFRNLVADGTDSVSVYVYHNTIQLFSANGNTTGTSSLTLTEEDGTFDIDELDVANGDTISFVVGRNNNRSGDETALQARIVALPPLGSVLVVR